MGINTNERSTTKIDFTNLSQFLNMEELSEHVVSIKEDTKASEVVGYINIPIREAFFLFEIASVLRDKLGILVDSSWINTRIIRAFHSSDAFISLFSLTKKYRFSMSEVLKLRSISAKEERMLKNLILASSGRAEVKSKVSIIRMELTQNDEAIFDIEGESPVLEDLVSCVMSEFKRLFSMAEIEKNMKLFIVRCCVISLIYSNMKQ